MFRKILKCAFLLVLFVAVIDPFMHRYLGRPYGYVMQKLRCWVQEAWNSVSSGGGNGLPHGLIVSKRLVVPDGLDSSEARKDVVEEALSYVGAPYRFVGENRSGTDCSGLVFSVYKKVGVEMPRSASTQYLAAHPVDYDELRPGDLVFFRTARKPVGHVAVFVGGGKIVHASSNRERVVAEPLYVAAISNRVVGFRRVLD